MASSGVIDFVACGTRRARGPELHVIPVGHAVLVPSVRPHMIGGRRREAGPGGLAFQYEWENAAAVRLLGVTLARA